MTIDVSSHDLAVLCARACDDKLATDIAVLPVGDVLAVTEYFVVASASNPRQVRAITDAVLTQVRETVGRGPLRSEGVREQQDRKSTRLNSSHTDISRMPSSA